MKPVYPEYIIKLEGDYINVYGVFSKSEERVSWSGLPDWLRNRTST